MAERRASRQPTADSLKSIDCNGVSLWSVFDQTPVVGVGHAATSNTNQRSTDAKAMRAYNSNNYSSIRAIA